MPTVHLLLVQACAGPVSTQHNSAVRPAPSTPQSALVHACVDAVPAQAPAQGTLPACALKVLCLHASMFGACAQEQKAKKAARQAKREPVLTTRYAPSQSQSYAPVGAPLHEVSSYTSSTHMGSPGYYSPVHPSHTGMTHMGAGAIA